MFPFFLENHIDTKVFAPVDYVASGVSSYSIISPDPLAKFVLFQKMVFNGANICTALKLGRTCTKRACKVKQCFHFKADDYFQFLAKC